MTVIYAVGDGATGNSDSQALADHIANRKPDAFLYLGDVYESGTASEFAANYRPSWGQLDDRVYPIPGNHDWPNYSTGFQPYFAGLSPGPNYFVSIGGWKLWMLNSEDLASALAFVETAQAELTGRQNIACWHRPRYCSGSHGDALDIDPLWQLLAPHCPVVLSGHAHNAQLFKPDSTGCRQVVSGAGGRGLYAEIPNDPRLEWGEATGYCACRLELGASGALTVAFEDHVGETLETFRVVG